MIKGSWVSVAAADVKKLSQGTTRATPSADPRQSEKLAAELKTSAENLLEGARVVRDQNDRTHLTATTSTVKAYEQGKRIVEAMKKTAGDPASHLLDEAIGAEMKKAPEDKPIVLDLWVDNGTFKAAGFTLLQFVAGNTGRATLRVEMSTGTEIAAPSGAEKLDLSTISESVGAAAGAAGDDGARTWADLLGSQTVLAAVTEGGKPAAHLTRAAADMAVPGVAVKVVRRGVAQVTSGRSVACVTVPATTAGRPKVVEGAC